MLLIQPNPYGNESLRGYIHRCAQLNGYMETVWLYKSMYWMIHNKTINLHFPTETMDWELPRQMLGQEEGVLRNMILGFRMSPNYARLEDKVKIHLKQFGSSALRPKICPVCISEEPYHRIEWEMSLVVSCPKHGCLLIDECQACGKPLNVLKIDLHRCQCGFRYEKSKLLCKDGALSSYLVRRLLNPMENNLQSNVFLDALSFEQMYYLLLFSVRWVKSEGKMHSDTSQRIYTGNQYENGEKAFESFQNWPNNFYSLIDDFRMRKQKNYAKNSIKEKFIDPITEIHGYEVFEQAIHYYTECYLKVGFSARFTARKRVVPKHVDTGEANRIEVAEILNVYPNQIPVMVAKGILQNDTQALERKSDSCKYIFDKHEAYRLLNNLRSKSIVSERTDLLSFREALYKAYQFKCDLPNFLLLILQDKIQPYEKGDSTLKGLDILFFDYENVQKQLNGAYIRIEDIAMDLQIKKHGVYHWINRGLIGESELEESKVKLIPTHEYNKFKEEYILAIHIVRAPDNPFKSSEKLLRTLKTIGIVPVNENKHIDELYVLRRTAELNSFLQSIRLHEMK
ncbi:TniQ family protein [Paenibacillus xylanexedens]|uniref:TniQ family protein n=1 Tax=Paenibacillus xylanexedens TaxID=528191 RepID=UPI0011A0253D|nr:TniQ family protein [Paenibacillus xylanexedens]